jgi:hypothetical protein
LAKPNDLGEGGPTPTQYLRAQREGIALPRQGEGDKDGQLIFVGHKRHPLAGLGEAFLACDLTGALHHVVEIADVLGHDAVGGPTPTQCLRE